MEDMHAFIMDQYKELTVYSDNVSGRTALVRHTMTGQLYIRKELHSYDIKTYEVLKAAGEIPGIPKIHYLKETDGVLVIIEDFIHGRTYEDIRHEKALDTVDVVWVAWSLCRILEPLHGLVPPVIHRDIKPSNVMLSADGVVKLIDFNAARLYKADVGEDTSKLGTVGFAAPEQFGFTQTDARTDIYALGVFMNVLLTGMRPNDLLTQGPLRPIIKKCVEFSPQNRYQSIDALEAALRRLDKKLAGHQGITRQQDKTVSSKESWYLPGFRSHTLWKGALAVMGYVLIFFIITYQGQNGGTAQPMSLTERLALGLGCFGEVLLAFNYRGIRDGLPMMHHQEQWVRVVFGILWGIALFCVVLCVCVLLESAFYSWF
jgi:hypothetical protein